MQDKTREDSAYVEDDDPDDEVVDEPPEEPTDYQGDPGSVPSETDPPAENAPAEEPAGDVERDRE